MRYSDRLDRYKGEKLMAYEMHEWVCNEPITADKLNHMEQGIVEAQNDESSGGDVLVVQVDQEATTAEKTVYDKTWQEVYDALNSNRRVVMRTETATPMTLEVLQILAAYKKMDNSNAPYRATALAILGACGLEADTADGYLYRTTNNE